MNCQTKPSLPRLRRSAVLAVVTTLLAGCTTSPITLSDQYRSARQGLPEETTNTTNPGSADGNCALIGQVKDSRLAPSTMGQVGLRTIKSPIDVTGWVRSSFATLNCSSSSRVAAQPETMNAVTLEVDLLKAWINEVNSSVATSLVFKVRYFRLNVLLKEKIYRGGDTSVNWASGQGEIQSHFDASMQKVLQQVHGDLSRL